MRRTMAPQGALRTLALIKPDAVRRGLVGSIIHEVERSGSLKVARAQTFFLSVDQAATFYQDHHDKPYYWHLVNFTSSGILWALMLETIGAWDAIVTWRELMGPFSKEEQKPHQIRYKFRDENPMMAPNGLWGPSVENLVHGSDSVRAYAREAGMLWPR